MHLNQLFRDGFFVSSIDRITADRLLGEIKADTFVEDRPGSPDIAAWEVDNPSQNHNIPPVYLSFMEQLGLSEATQHLRSHMGDWSRTNCMLQRGKKGDSMVWHHDSYDPMHLICLLYLSEDIWHPEDGGMLQLGEGDIDEHGFLVDPESVSIKASVSPNHGTLVWAINTNPRWVHRVTEIASEKTRYTMVGQFGYRENVMRTRVKEKYGREWR
ncbi:2OG-Fe(II) oxygenase [Pseudomonas aeruginosa]|uniref:2OG-Fe(II) oxygenase n=1 Tax=Ectopseudomonas oleovorans TaxID=301 RepID=UPI0008B5FA3E|nr:MULTISPECIES: 2OG-Fe(II) oxygenase [Pseudomonas aeruginosa group]MDY1219298.1 2OG-Fe(II) oxygenase [Pseudomonas aeruginosa]SEJ98328.1 2OG-Fe(II) oxygenase superfamily protein [Pseudomonas oleovorans]HBO7921546.1 2OG-Fe(II) oxygenase [Pseudomonas aeruginosa]